jgi:hypothetical protein
MKPFLLMSLPRSGSKMLCSMLGSHPQIACPHEPFFNQERRDNYRAYLESLQGEVVIGHVHFHHLSPAMFADAMPKILLERDYADGAISQILNGSRRPDRQFEIKREYVQIAAEERQRRTEIMRPHADLVLTYEQLTTTDASKLICEFLGVDVMPLLPRTRKTPPSRPANYEALRG